MATLTRGERFKDAREVHSQHGKQTMEVVAKATGVSKSLIHSLEDDESTRSVGYDKIAKLAAYYGVSCDYLLGLSPNPTLDKELDAVCKYTGLSERAVKALRAARSCIDNDPNCAALMQDCYPVTASSDGRGWHENFAGKGIIDFIDAIICALTKPNDLLFQVISMYQETTWARKHGNVESSIDDIHIDHKRGTITIPRFLFRDLSLSSLAKELLIALQDHYFTNKGRS